MPAMAADARADGLFSATICSGELRAVRRSWERHGIAGERWAGYLLGGRPGTGPKAMLDGEPAVHLIGGVRSRHLRGRRRGTGCTAFVERFDPAARSGYDDLVGARPRSWPRCATDGAPCTGGPRRSVPGIRFYRGATGDWYHPTEESAADAITEQMLAPGRLPGLIERAWHDGVRVFVEHGPAAQCTGWIRRILGEREHVAVALDAGPGQGLWSVSTVVAELAAAGVPVRHDALEAYFATSAAPRRGPTISLPKRLPAPRCRRLRVHGDGARPGPRADADRPSVGAG